MFHRSSSIALFAAATFTVPALAQSSYFYVTNAHNQDVVRFDGDTGAFDRIFCSPGYSGGLVFGPDGNLYVSSTESDVVRRYAKGTGAFIDNFASGGGLDRPVGLAFGIDGNLYVSSQFTDQVLRYDGSSGAFMDVFASGGGITNPVGLEFGPDGNLYVAGITSSAVFRYDGSTGDFMDVFASGGGLVYPRDLEFGPDGNLYVPGVLSNQVHRYDGCTGTFIDAFITVSGNVALEGLIFGPDGQLYLAAPGPNYNEVHKYDASSGAFLEVFASGPELFAPFFMIFDPPAQPPVSLYNFCQTAQNSVGRGALIGSSGSVSIAQNCFTLEATGSVPNAFGLFYYGPEELLVRFGNGARCVGAGATGTFRLGPAVAADGAGEVAHLLNFTTAPAGSGPGAILPGSTWKFQWWYRDNAAAGGTGNFNLSDGLSSTFLP